MIIMFIQMIKDSMNDIIASYKNIDIRIYQSLENNNIDYIILDAMLICLLFFKREMMIMVSYDHRKEIDEYIYLSGK
ncbi:MAG: hypothetical protein ACI4SR_09215 [Faecalibacillus sp.]